ncbi:sugar phosphate isomerase/epimerase [bacterium]|nr:sugar phosphate isomerase/epimerase [bacterium]
MRIGFLTNFIKERISFAKKEGFRCCELRVSPTDDFFPGNPDWEAKAMEVKNYCDERDIRISCLAGFYVNIMDESKEDEYKKLVRNVIILAEKMKVKVVAGFSGRVVGQPLKESISKYKELWGEHAKFAEDHNIKIAFENCPMGKFYTPCGGINFFSTPEMWDLAFNEVNSEVIGLEWDPSHLICLFIDPLLNLKKYGSRIYHIHAKDAHINKELLDVYGIWYPGVVEHCFAGFGDTDWNLVIKELHKQGYSNDLNIEGWHDKVYRDTATAKREDEGLILSLRYLEKFVVQD